MTQGDDREFEKTLQRVVKNRVDSMSVSPTFQSEVFARIHADGSKQGKGYKKGSVVKRLWQKPLWQSVAAVAVVCVIAIAGTSIQQPSTASQAANSFAELRANNTNTNSFANSIHAANSALQKSANANESSQVLFGSLAPISTEDVQLIPGVAGTSSASDSTSATGSAVTQSGPIFNHGIASLSVQRFTVRCKLYNSSSSPISGKKLQGMMFLLDHAGQLSPTTMHDWEYFVNGPNTVIPPHQSVTWSFSPNPSPSYTTLKNRYVHIIWLYNHPNTGAANVVMSTLPVEMKNVHLNVYQVVTPGIQLMRIRATINNTGTKPLALSSLLGMIFFKTDSHASWLSKSTYKYFDDVQPLGNQPQIVPPGHSGQVEFEIVGVPGVNMTQLSMSLLVIKRSEVGA